MASFSESSLATTAFDITAFSFGEETAVVVDGDAAGNALERQRRLALLREDEELLMFIMSMVKQW